MNGMRKVLLLTVLFTSMCLLASCGSSEEMVQEDPAAVGTEKAETGKAEAATDYGDEPEMEEDGTIEGESGEEETTAIYADKVDIVFDGEKTVPSVYISAYAGKQKPADLSVQNFDYLLNWDYPTTFREEREEMFAMLSEVDGVVLETQDGGSM